MQALEEAGVAYRLHREGLPHDGFDLAFDGERHRIDLRALTGKSVMVYGQTEITRNLFDRRCAEGQRFFFDVDDVTPGDLTSDPPRVHFRHEDREGTVTCDYVAGCGGFPRVSRTAIRDAVLRTFKRVYPFGWLGIMVDRPPAATS